MGWITLFKQIWAKVPSYPLSSRAFLSLFNRPNQVRRMLRRAHVGREAGPVVSALSRPAIRIWVWDWKGCQNVWSPQQLKISTTSKLKQTCDEEPRKALITSGNGHSNGSPTVSLPGTWGVEDAVIFQLHRPSLHLKYTNNTMRVMFLYFSSVFLSVHATSASQPASLLLINDTFYVRSDFQGSQRCFTYIKWSKRQKKKNI